jgi:subtilase family serine protease
MRIGPDLIESSVIIPAVGGAGLVLTVTDTVKNNGTGNAGPSTTSFYLSTNGSFDAADQLLGTRQVPSLVSTATSTASTPLTIPIGTATGSYYILARSDSNNDVIECAESNNMSYGTTKIGPDLTVTALSSSATTIVAGSTITVTDTTKNAGGGPAPGSNTQYYLSTNFSFDASDVLLGSRPVPALAVGASQTGGASIVIPASTAAGSYYILAVADGDATVVESTETNNTRSLFIKITVGG